MQPFFKSVDEKKLTAIVISVDNDKKVHAAKYKGIDNSARGISTFMAMVRNKFPGAEKVNFYGKERKFFIDKIYLE